MKRFAVLAVAMVCLCGIARAQSLTITAPAKVQAGTLVRVTVKAEGVSDKLPLVWEFPTSEIPGDGPDQPSVAFASAVEQTAKGRSLLFAWPKAGALTFKVSAFLAVKDGDEVVGFTPIQKTFLIEQTGGLSGPEEVLILPAPSAALTSAVEPIGRQLAGHRDIGGELARMYAAIALVVEDGHCKTTSALRSTLEGVGQSYLRGTVRGKVPGLADAIDGFLTAQLTLEDRPIDAALRPQVVAVLRALGWACNEEK